MLDTGTVYHTSLSSQELCKCDIIPTNATNAGKCTVTAKSSGAEKTAVLFGAGCVGRGFLGQLLSESGYTLTFVEIDEPLIAALNARRAYTLRLMENDRCEDLVISAARTLYSRADETLVTALSETSLVTTAVGVRSLPDIAPLIAAGIVRRAERDVTEPLNILSCWNMQDSSGTFKAMVLAHVPIPLHAYTEAHICFVDVVIGRTIPRPTPEMREADCSYIISYTYKKLPVNRSRFVGPLPEIAGLLPTDDFTAYIERKLYLHNCGHAILGYLGYQRGHRTELAGARRPGDPRGVGARFRRSARRVPGCLHDGRRRIGQLHRRIAAEFRQPHPGRYGRPSGARSAAQTWSQGAIGGRSASGRKGQRDARRAQPGHRRRAYRFDNSRSAGRGTQRRIATEGIEAVMADVSSIQAAEPLGQLVIQNFSQCSVHVSTPPPANPVIH